MFLHVKVSALIDVIEGPLIVGVGQNASWFCRVKEGDPPPNVTWTKDGDALMPTNDQRILVQGDRILIKVVQKDDRGLYSCHAVNEAGELASPKLKAFRRNLLFTDTMFRES